MRKIQSAASKQAVGRENPPDQDRRLLLAPQKRRRNLHASAKSASRVVPHKDPEAARTMGLKDAARAARPHPGARYAGVSTGTAFFESMPRTRTRPPKLSSRGRRGKAGNEGIHAHSPQAKGRVERPNLTLKVRLIKEIRLMESTTWNAPVPGFPPLLRTITGALQYSPAMRPTCIWPTPARR